MTASSALATPVAAIPTDSPRARSPFPSTAALALEQMPMHELEKVFVRGVTPDIDSLVGWEFRGINHLLFRLPITKLFGIKKFVKGFYRDDARVMGYNIAVENNVLDGRWHLKPSDDSPRRFGFYEVGPVDATSRDNAYLHATLLDYGKGGNPRMDPTSGLRDYLVQVDPRNPDLFLGKAYFALGPVRIRTNFFILERHRVGLTNYVRR